MKLIIFFLACLINNAVHAQDPQLFDNDWYLQKLEIADIDYPTPQNSELDNIPLQVFPEFFDTIVCIGLTGDEISISNTSIFVPLFIILVDEPCDLQVNNDYENLYYNIFFKWQLPDRTFEYILEDNGTDLALILTSVEGNKAFYSSVPLAIKEINLTKFSIFPNPANEILKIKSNKATGNLNIQIFSAEGKLLKTQNLNNQTSIDVSNFSSGIYFLNIEDDEGNVTVKKFVKQ